VLPSVSWAQRHAQRSAIAEEGDLAQQSRKRRKSQMEREHEAEWNPESSQGTAGKRASKAAKVESAIDDDVYEIEMTPKTPNRRKSAATARQSFGSVESASPPGSASAAPENAGQASSSSRRKGREAKPRINLSEDQKRANHIQSEQKRRNIIKQGYEDLNQLVPSLAGGKSGFSKSEILKEVVAYLENLIAGNTAMESHFDRLEGPSRRSCWS